MNRRWSLAACLVSIFLAIHSFCKGQEPRGPYHPGYAAPGPQGGSPPGLPTRQEGLPPVKMLAPGVFDIGGVLLKKSENSVEFPAVVNMNKGLLEYLIVGEGGKVHESLLRTPIQPYNLQIALLMLGLEGTTTPLREQGDPRRPEGDPVTISIRLEGPGGTVSEQVEEWVFNKAENGPMGTVQWVFTGSFISGGVFMAQAEKSIVAIYHDPVAMIDNPLSGGASDEIWFVHEAKAPAVGTPVRVTIQAGKKGE